MTLNKRERIFMWFGAVLIVVMCFVPPWRWRGWDYRPIFLPSDGASIDLYRLGVQIFGVAVLTAACMYYHGGRRR